MKPRHLFVKPNAQEGSWTVFIGNFDVGTIRRETNGSAKVLQFYANWRLSQRTVDFKAPTMRVMKEQLIERISRATYESILDDAYKNNRYKG
jgi:hypothetical protein